MNRLAYFGMIISAAALILLSSCSSVRQNPGKVLLEGVKLDISNDELDYYDLDGLIKQKPTRRFYRGIYNLGNAMKDRSAIKEKKIRKKMAEKRAKQNAIIIEGQQRIAAAENQREKEKIRLKYQRKKEKLDFVEAEELAAAQKGLRNWLMTTVGEAPVFFDSVQTLQSMRQMELYCHKHGYFNASISDSVRMNKNGTRIKQLTYSVEAGKPYVISSFTMETSDPGIRSYWLQGQRQTLIHEGDVYDEDMLERERMRINDDLRNDGYFAFSKSYIRFEADSSSGNNTISIRMLINRPSRINRSVRDSIEFYNHRRYQIRRIYVEPEFSITVTGDHSYDTSRFVKKLRSGTDTLYFLSEGSMRVKQKTIARKIFFRTGDYFSLSRANKTQSELSNLNVFKYINIRFVPDTTGDRILTIVPVDAMIELSVAPVQAINAEIEGTNSAGNLGTAGNLVYKNRNLFRGAEQFNFKVKGGLELQKSAFSDDESQIGVLPFNSAEFSTSAGLSMPFNSRLFTQSNRPVLKFSTGFSYQLRPDYERYISHLKASLEFKESDQRVMEIYAPVNLVRIFPDSLFAIRISQFSRTIRYSYEDHFIPGLGFSVTSTNQHLRKNKPYNYWKLNIEKAGLMFWAFNSFNSARQGEIYRVLGINYSQYVKFDIDFRNYIPVNKRSVLAYRTFLGAGLPYGNSVLMPFEKSYSASGSNDIRAWKFRSLGPGSYTDENSTFDRTGDISIVLSLEYRFPLFSWFNGALFVDAGNVWNLYSSDEFPGGEFLPDQFIKQFAIGPGFGLRMDFDFFIFRVDGAFPIRDPMYPAGEMWLGFDRFLARTNFSFGIGYPF